MLTSRLYNVKQREAFDSRRLQHLLKGISHLAHKNWGISCFPLTCLCYNETRTPQVYQRPVVALQPRYGSFYDYFTCQWLISVCRDIEWKI